MKKWSTPSFVTYLSKRSHIPKKAPVSILQKSKPKSTTSDVKTEIKRKTMNSNKPPEKGIKIIVGGPEQHKAVESEAQPKANNPEHEDAKPTK